VGVVLSKRGRPRESGKGIIPVAREGAGRVKRQTKAQQELETKIVVLKQPHRKGDIDQRREHALGRLVLDGRVSHPDKKKYTPAAMNRAAELYAKAYSDMRWVMASRRPLSVTTPGPTSTMTEAQEAARASDVIATWSALNKALNAKGERVKKAAEYVILDNITLEQEQVLPFWILYSLTDAMEALVDFYGLGEG
jgi:hypothetical protein